MKITDLKVHLLTGHWGSDPWFPRYLFSTAIIRIETDAKLEGLGEVSASFFVPEAVPAIAEFFKPLLIGRDPLDIDALIKAMYDGSVWWGRAGLGRGVQSGIELALWDLKGKALGLPVYRLIGGKLRERVPVYASGGGSYWPIAETVRKVSFYRRLGYRATKLATNFHHPQRVNKKTGHTQVDPVHFPFSRRIENLNRCFAQLRRVCGDDMDLAVDGHQGATPNPIPVSEAVATAQALAPHRLRFYEEPLAYTNLDGYCELRAQSPIPIAGGESLTGVDQFHNLISRAGVDFVQPDVGVCGGLLETVKILHHAEAFNVGTIPHTGGSFGPVLAAAWHLAVAHPNIPFLEHVPAARSMHDDFLVEPLKFKDGSLAAPTAPGLGVRLTPKLLEKYRFVPGTGART